MIQDAAPVALKLVNGEPISYVANSTVSVYSKSLAPRMDQSDGWQKTYTQGVPYYRPCQVIDFLRVLEVFKSCNDENSLLP